MSFYKLFFIVFCCWVWMGCNIINPPEKTPTYIHIDSFAFTNPHPGIDGSPSHAIGSVWVTYNGSLVGVYDLPATIPIIATGKATLDLGPGVTLNGRNNFQAVYPFYFDDTSTFTALPGKIVNYQPHTRYIDNGIAFPLMEDFELGCSFDTLSSGEVPMVRTTSLDSVFEGKGSGAIRLTKATDSSEIVSSLTSITIPTGNSYCEFNYKGTLNLAIGMFAITGTSSISQYIYGFNPSNTWQKIYVSLGEFVQTYSQGTYRLEFKATLPAGQTSGYLLMDNIKIVDVGN